MFSKYLFAFCLYVHFSLSLRTVESSQAYIQFTYKYFFVNTPATYILLYQMNFLLRCFKFPKRLRRSSYSGKLDFRCFKSQITVLLQTERQYGTFHLSLRKICQNTGFFWPVFFYIRKMIKHTLKILQQMHFPYPGKHGSEKTGIPAYFKQCFVQYCFSNSEHFLIVSWLHDGKR